MSDQSQGPGWWIASDGKWYPPHLASPPPPAAPPPLPESLASSQKPLWKRPWVVVSGVILLILIIVAATSSSDEKDQVSSDSSTTTTTAEEERTTATVERTTTTAKPTTTTTTPEFTVGDKIEYTDGSSIQVFTWEQPVPPADEYSIPEDGFEFGVLDVEVCAGPGDDGLASYNPLALSARMADNRVYDDAFGNAREPDLSSGDIPAGGGCRRGFVTLSVPTGQRPVALLWDYASRQAEWLL